MDPKSGLEVFLLELAPLDHAALPLVTRAGEKGAGGQGQRQQRRFPQVSFELRSAQAR